MADVMVALGWMLMAVGVGMIYAPGAVIVLGIGLIILGLLLARRGAGE